MSRRVRPHGPTVVALALATYGFATFFGLTGCSSQAQPASPPTPAWLKGKLEKDRAAQSARPKRPAPGKRR